MIILFVDFYNLTICLNVDDFDYLEFLMEYFASFNFLILMKQSWTMLTNVTNKHIKVQAQNAFDEWCKLQGYDTKNSYH